MGDTPNTNKAPSIPGYTVKQPLGKGGMATVFLAEQKSIGRLVALKVMSKALGEDSHWAKRFIQEAQVIAQLSHPNIIPVFDVGAHEGHFYIAMEYMKGGNLKDRIRQGVSVADTIKIIVGIAAGLDFAGEKGFVHRDIKPDNIMFREDGSPVILDFGIVKQKNATDSQSQMTQAGVIVGTTTYMSPEQAQGKPLDERSDIYSLTVLFFELLTGKQPFKGESDVATLLKHINEPIPLLPTAIKALQPVINKGLSKTAEARYPRAREMIEHMQALESEIKPLLNISKKINQLNPDDETAIIQTGGDDTVEVEALVPNITAQNDNADITRVLSSAKNTIKNFSEESRNKKAKKSRMTLISASLVAVSALSYIGYQQGYLAPMERKAAQHKIEQAALTQKNKINNLLNQAQEIEQTFDDNDTKQAYMLLTLYKKALTLDPEHINTQQKLKALGLNFLALSHRALKNNNVEIADQYRDYAQRAAPNALGLITLQANIRQYRSKKTRQDLGKELREKKIQTLFNIAEKEMNYSKRFSEKAYTSFLEILNIDANHKASKQHIDTMLEDLYLSTYQNIKDNNISQVAAQIQILNKYYPDTSKISQLSTLYSKKKQKLSAQQQKTALLKKSKKLMREKRSIAINDELRHIFNTVLKTENNNQMAIKGIQSTNKFDQRIALQAIKDRDYDRARQQIIIIERDTPNYYPLASIKNTLESAIKNNQQASKHITNAKKLYQMKLSPKERRSQLVNAVAALKSARHLDPIHPELEASIKALENIYVGVISKLMQENNENELLDLYFKDSAELVWPSTRIVSLQNQKPKKKTKRVITGGF